jgi:hypothetical protein
MHELAQTLRELADGCEPRPLPWGPQAAARPLPHPLNDYYRAMTNVGPLATLWDSAPQQLMAELIGAIRHYQELLPPAPDATAGPVPPSLLAPARA